MSCWVSLLPILLLFTDHVISEGCGRRIERPVFLISQGVPSTLGLWPWHVAVMHGRNPTTAQYACGGTIISAIHVLTAAHCTYSKTGVQLGDSDIFIRAGISKLSEKHSLQEVRLSVFGIERHRGYQTDTGENDIALLKLYEELILTDYVKPICLWKDAAEEELIVGKLGFVAGWGKDEHGNIPDQLQHAAMPIASREKCKNSDPDYYLRYLFDRKAFCAGFRNGTSPQAGDSGGGFYIKINNRWFLRGIVSNGKFDWVTQQLDTSEYIVFTDVAYFKPWINQKTEMWKCGQRTVLLSLTNNKSESSLGEWPWHAAVMHRITKTSFKYACGGTIITNSYILTVAYCINSLTSKGHVEPSDICIRAGITNLQQEELSQQQIEVAEIKIHRSFDDHSAEGDIALLKLDGKLMFTNYVKPICLWRYSIDQNNMLDEPVYITGWDTNDRDTFSNQLKHVGMVIVSQEKCADSVWDFNRSFFNETFFCAAFQNGSSVMSGSNHGTIYIKRGGQWLLLGITSMGNINQATGQANMSSNLLFTDVKHFQPWVINEIPIGDCGQYTDWSDGRWPWQTAVMHRTAGGSSTYACGGTIISSSYVLTAAQCIVEPVEEMRPKSGLFIQAGILHHSNHSLQEITVAETIIHEEFNKNYTFANNDIALLKLERKLTFTHYRKALCLWNDRTDDDFFHEMWGNVGKDTNGYFEKIWVKILLQSECKIDKAVGYEFADKYLCAAIRYVENKMDHFGKGMFVEIANRYFLRGIISNASINQSEVIDATSIFSFTDIALHLSWINDKTGIIDEDGVQYCPLGLYEI